MSSKRWWRRPRREDPRTKRSALLIQCRKSSTKIVHQPPCQATWYEAHTHYEKKENSGKQTESNPLEKLETVSDRLTSGDRFRDSKDSKDSRP